MPMPPALAHLRRMAIGASFRAPVRPTAIRRLVSSRLS
jgi:hypothetical protein